MGLCAPFSTETHRTTNLSYDRAFAGSDWIVAFRYLRKTAERNFSKVPDNRQLARPAGDSTSHWFLRTRILRFKTPICYCTVRDTDAVCVIEPDVPVTVTE
jgi:hypothetical protein